MNCLKWNYIMDIQPQHDEEIIQCNKPCEGHYTMGMRTYYQKCTWEELIKYYKDNDLGYPDFYWISAKDFPFPDQDKYKE